MRRDWPDIWGGLALAALGAFSSGWALAHYEFGTLRQMGAGFFPAVLGATLAVLGLTVALPALRRAGGPLPVQQQTAAAVIASILIFGFALSRLGLVGATAASVLVATLPAPRPGRLWRVVLTAAVTALTVLVFSFGLRMTVPLLPR